MTGPLAMLNTDKTFISRVEGYNLQPGNEKTLAAIVGPGYIKKLWMAIGGGNNPCLDGRLRLYYDGSSTPAMDIDLGSLLALHWGATGSNHVTTHTKAALDTAHWQLDFTLLFPIPFGVSVRVAYYLPNLSSQVAGLFSMVDYCLTSTDTANGLRLRCSGARFADQSVMRQIGDTATLLDTAGAIKTSPGTIAAPQQQVLTGPGSVVYISYVGGCNSTTGSLSWLERNFALSIDGEGTPSWETTGTEDTFDSGWYFDGLKDQPIGRYSYIATNQPTSMPYCIGMATDLLGKLGGLPFSQSALLQVLTEPAVTTGDRLSWAVLYYQ